MSSSIGTSGVLFAHADDCAIDPSGRIHAFAHAVPGRYCVLAVTLAAGGSLRWWRDVTGLTYDELVAEAAAVPPGSEGLVFLPYLMGERTPHLDPRATGGFFGLTARHTRGHMTRALMEGVLFSLRDGLEIMRGLDVDPDPDPGDRWWRPRPSCGCSCRPTSSAHPCSDSPSPRERLTVPRCSGTSRRGRSRRGRSRDGGPDA